MKFTYNGKSTDDYGLIVSAFDSINTLESGLHREIIKGEATDYRLIPNHFGTAYSSVIEFTRALIKKDGSKFSKEEISSITCWLTSSKIPKELTYYHGCSNEDTIKKEMYHGLFTNIQYTTATDGIIGIIFTFTNDSPFIRVPVSTTFTFTQPEHSFTITNDSDLTDDYIYPTISLCYDSTDKNLSDVTLTNITDNGNQMNLKCLSKLNTVIDCQHLTVSEATGKVGYDTLGWADIDDIYWLRLAHGINELKIKTSATPLKVAISYTLLKKGGELFEY